MKRLIIICEGPTEVEFCKDVLYLHLLEKETIIQTPLIRKSGGGIVPWPALLRQIENHLKQESTAIVTTFIDYYGIKESFEFPKWNESKKMIDRGNRMELLEGAMKDSVHEDLKHRFIPYIQLHEFEGLLFSEMKTFTDHIPEDDFINIHELHDTIQNNPNPELINDTPGNAPSYRLKRLIKGYNKIVYGAILAREIGLTRIRAKCPRFNGWITKLETV